MTNNSNNSNNNNICNISDIINIADISDKRNDDIEKALILLQQGHLVGIPTETVYGLAARIDSPEALKNIFKMKNRPFFDPLIIHVSSVDQAKALVKEWPYVAQVLVEKFWPGPLTLVLSKNENVNPLITAGLETVAIRMPQQALTLELLRRLVIPVAAPSANQFGHVSPTQAFHVKEEFPNENLFVLDGGASLIGLESTVASINERRKAKPAEQAEQVEQVARVQQGEQGAQGAQKAFRKTNSDDKNVSEDDSLELFVELRILRKGAVTKSQLTECLQEKMFNKGKFAIYEEETRSNSGNYQNEISPGRMKHHYMPSIPMVLLGELFYSENKIELKKVEWKNKILAEFSKLPDEIEGVRILKPKRIENFGVLELNEDPALAAREFYHQLRNLSSQPNDLIFFIVKQKYQEELWQALMERARKAASLDLTGISS